MTDAAKDLQKAELETQKETQDRLLDNLSTTKKTFDDLAKAYDKGYSQILKERDAFSKRSFAAVIIIISVTLLFFGLTFYPPSTRLFAVPA